jgi:predicted RNase H-like HicB family nuclease
VIKSKTSAIAIRIVLAATGRGLRRDGEGSLRYYFGLLFENPAGGFGVWFPDVPECTAIGSSLEETRSEAAKSLALHLADLTRHGLPIPEPSPIETALADPDNRAGFPVIVPCFGVFSREL